MLLLPLLSLLLAPTGPPVKNTMEMDSPKRYSCRPQAPTAFMMDALWMTRTGMPRERARNSRSV